MLESIKETVTILPLVTAILVEVIKRTDFFGKKWLPLVSTIVGIFVTFVAFQYSFTFEVLFVGIISGAIASGIYDVVKKSILRK